MHISIIVKPGSKKGPLVIANDDGSFTVFLKQRAIDGAANAGLVEVLASHFGVSKSKVEIASGFTSRHKRVVIEA